MTQIGTIGRHATRPERLALLRPDGTVASWFGFDDTIETIREKLAEHGLTVADDGSVTKA